MATRLSLPLPALNSHFDMSQQSRREFVIASAAGVAASTVAIAASSNATELNAAEKTQDDDIIIRPLKNTPPLMEGFPPPLDQRVTINNFTDTNHHMRWAMLNTDSVFKTIEVENASSPFHFPRRLRNPEHVDGMEVSFEGTKIKASDWLERTETDALLVIHDGTIVVEFYFGQMRPATRHLTWSLGKALLSLLVLQNADIDLSARIDTYQTKLKRTAFAGASVQHVLDQQTGLAFQETPPDNDPDTLEAYTFGTASFRTATHEYAAYERTAGILPLLPSESVTDGLYDLLFRQTKTARPHGKALWYAEPNVIALQHLLEITYKKRVLELLESLLWLRIGTEHRINAIVDGLGTPAFGTGISMTARDIGRLGQLLLNYGKFNGQKIVAERHIDDILNTRNTSALNTESNLGDWKNYGAGYRNLFWTWPSPNGKPLLSALGLYGQHCVVDYNNRNVIVKLSTNPNIAHLAEDVMAISSLSRQLS